MQRAGEEQEERERNESGFAILFIARLTSGGSHSIMLLVLPAYHASSASICISVVYQIMVGPWSHRVPARSLLAGVWR